jgi:ABC-type phosphate transport system auxiliary subunit
MADELSQTSPARLMSSTQRTLSHEACDTMQPAPVDAVGKLTYRPNSTLPESIGVWADGVPVPLPPLVRPVATREATRSMVAELHGKDFLALTSGRLARWGHLGAVGSWWEARR